MYAGVGGVWILQEGGSSRAEVIELSGEMKYADTQNAAIAQVEALALRVLAERIKAGNHLAEPIQITFATA